MLGFPKYGLLETFLNYSDLKSFILLDRHHSFLIFNICHHKRKYKGKGPTLDCEKTHQ